jgi:predicted dehydrogenase
MKPLSAGIVGLGQIGQGYDYDSKDEHEILTHATGFEYHSNYDLVGGVDPDYEKRKRFEKKFSKPAYATVNELFSTYLDVVSIGVPTPLHFDVFQEIIKHSPRAVICEKPIASNVKEAEQMLQLSKMQNTSLLVNYMRRFEPGVLELKEKIRQKEFGKIYKGTVWYSKGILNNGSHFIDLLRFLLGDITDIKILSKGRKWNETDPEPDVQVVFEKAPIYFLAGREECFSSMEIELIGEKGKIRYEVGGGDIYYHKTYSDPVFPGYTIIDPVKNAISNDSNRFQWHMLEHLANFFQNGTPLNSDGDTALETLKTIEKISTLLEECDV